MLCIGPSTIDYINDIPFDDIVFDKDIQNIIGKKIFNENIYLNGNAKIEIINGIDVANLYKTSVLMDDKNIFKNDIVIRN